MFEHMRWADERVQESVVNAANPPAQALDLLAHVVAAEHVWISRLLGETPQMTPWPKLSLSQCAELGAINAERFLSLAESVDDIALEGGITYRNSAGVEFTNSMRDILVHVALHGSYHRGQIAAAIRAGGDKPASTDYIAFVRGVPAATRMS
jgi:uncharacterized damage-inducible protein DinB